jgi:Phospholipase_D-nuclease N-terminal
MLYFDGLGGLVVLGVWIFCFIDVLLTPDQACRSLPKLGWIFLVLLIPLLGSVAWLVAGRPWDRAKLAQAPGAARTSRFPQDPRTTRATRVPTNPDDDEEFLAGLRKRAEEQRRRALDEQNPDRLDGDPT